MPVKSGIRNNRTRSTGHKAINDAKKRINGIPSRMVKQIPSGFYGGVASMSRRFFRDNFAAQEGWKQPYYTSNAYMAKKDKWVERGDFFQIGMFGIMPCIYASGEFGKLTGTIAEAIGTVQGSKSRTTISEVKGGVNINMFVGIDSSRWDGGSTHLYRSEKTGKEIKDKKADNQLEAFSARITPKGQRSVLARVWPGQRKQVASYARKILRRVVKRVYVKDAD